MSSVHFLSSTIVELLELLENNRADGQMNAHRLFSNTDLLLVMHVAFLLIHLGKEILRSAI